MQDVVSATRGPETEVRARQVRRCRQGARRIEHDERTENHGILAETLPQPRWFSLDQWIKDT